MVGVVTSNESDTDVPSENDFLIEWDERAEIESGYGSKAEWNHGRTYNFATGCITAEPPSEVASAEMITVGKMTQAASQTDHQDDNMDRFPSMPCINQNEPHRQKIGSDDRINPMQLFNSAVARPVGRKEMMENEDARKAMRKEWLGQHAEGVYATDDIREYDDLVRDAKRKGEEVHMARIHGICVEKNYQLPKGHPNRKFKGRGVLLGNQVKNQFWEAAFFQDLGNSPASFEASRWADFYGCLKGNDIKMADAIQAYIQAKLTGPACWVELPSDAWPDGVDVSKYRRPVVRLIKAFYGHPDSGTM